MRSKHAAGCLLLLATVLVSGCETKKDLVGRWDMGSSNFYFRKDGVAFYLSPSKVRYQGRYSYDGSADPGIVRAELQAIDSDRSPFTLELQVTFLSPDRVRFDRPTGGRNRSLLAARMAENLSNN